MSTNAGPGDDYYLRKIVDSVSFNKLTSPPLSYLDKGILYELTDGKLYYNGSALSTSTLIGDVVGPASSTTNSLALYADNTGKVIKATTCTLTEPAAGSMLFESGASTKLRVSANQFLATNSTQTNTNCISIGSNSLLSNSASLGGEIAIGANTLRDYVGNASSFNNVAIGTGAMSLVTTSQLSVAIGGSALEKHTGLNNIGIGLSAGRGPTGGNNNIYVGAGAGVSFTGTCADNIVIGYDGVHAAINGNIFIGRSPTHTTCTVAGIYNNLTNNGTVQNVMIDSTGKLFTGTPLSSNIFAQLNYSNVVGEVFNLTTGNRVTINPAATTFTQSSADFTKVGVGITYTGVTRRIKMDVVISGSCAANTDLTFDLKDDPNATILATVYKRFDTGRLDTISMSVVRTISSAQFLLLYITSPSNVAFTVNSFNMNVISI